MLVVSDNTSEKYGDGFAKYCNMQLLGLVIAVGEGAGPTRDVFTCVHVFC